MRSTSHDWDSDTEEPGPCFVGSDHMDLYLRGDIVGQSVIDDAGGVLCYWEQQLRTQPQLARMALDFLSAPGKAISAQCAHSRSHDLVIASSVDAERAFSGGRLQVNHLQHGMSSQTFKAQTAVSSWFGPPIFPSTAPFVSIIEDRMSHEKKVDGKKKVSVKKEEPESEADGSDEYTSTGE